MRSNLQKDPKLRIFFLLTKFGEKTGKRKAEAHGKTLVLLASLLLVGLIGSCKTEAIGPEITIGAMAPGTSWYVFGATLANLLKESLPENSRVEVVARGGGVGNPILVHRGDETIALAQTITTSWAYTGEPGPYRGKKHPNLRALVGGLNSVWVTAILRQDYIDRSGYETLEEALLSDPSIRIVMKPQGSSVPLVVDLILEILGTSRKQIVSRGGRIIQMTANQIPSLLRDEGADLYFETGLKGHPAVTEVSRTLDVRFVDIPERVLKGLEERGIRSSPMPEWFEGQSGPTQAVELGTIVIARSDLAPDLAYLIAKTICENKDRMGIAHKAWLDFDPTQAGSIENTAIPLHPGAKRYYREKGWL